MPLSPCPRLLLSENVEKEKVGTLMAFLSFQNDVFLLFFIIFFIFLSLVIDDSILRELNRYFKFKKQNRQETDAAS